MGGGARHTQQTAPHRQCTQWCVCPSCRHPQPPRRRPHSCEHTEGGVSTDTGTAVRHQALRGRRRTRRRGAPQQCAEWGHTGGFRQSSITRANCHSVVLLPAGSSVVENRGARCAGLSQSWRTVGFDTVMVDSDTVMVEIYPHRLECDAGPSWCQSNLLESPRHLLESHRTLPPSVTVYCLAVCCAVYYTQHTTTVDTAVLFCGSCAVCCSVQR